MIWINHCWFTANGTEKTIWPNRYRRQQTLVWLCSFCVSFMYIFYRMHYSTYELPFLHPSAYLLAIYQDGNSARYLLFVLKSTGLCYAVKTLFGSAMPIYIFLRTKKKYTSWIYLKMFDHHIFHGIIIFNTPYDNNNIGESTLVHMIAWCRRVKGH